MNVRALTKTLGRRVSAGVVGIGLVAGGLLAVTAAAPASAAPVGCTSDFYYVTNANPNQLIERSAAGVEHTTDLGALSTFTIAINPVDGQLYALSRNTATGNHLYQVAADGTSTDLGVVAGLPGSAIFAVAGFDDNGALWVYSPTETALRRVDVATMTSTTLPVSQPLLSDIAFVNGTMYTIAGTALPPAPKLARVDLTTGAVTATAVPGMTAVPTSLWSVHGHLYLSQGASIQEVLGFDTATPTLNQVATLSTGPADGASCDAAASPFLAATPDDFTSTPLTTGAAATTASLFANDTVNGAPFAPNAVVPTLTNDGGISGASLNADGTLSVPSTALPGDYTLTYRICAAANLNLCDTATVIVRLAAASSVSTVSGSGTAAATGSATLANTGSSTLLPLTVGGVLFIGGIAITAYGTRRRRLEN